MGEECYENAISTFFPYFTLSPAYLRFINESTWINDKDNLKEKMSYSLVNWDNIDEKHQIDK